MSTETLIGDNATDARSSWGARPALQQPTSEMILPGNSSSASKLDQKRQKIHWQVRVQVVRVYQGKGCFLQPPQAKWGVFQRISLGTWRVTPRVWATLALVPNLFLRNSRDGRPGLPLEEHKVRATLKRSAHLDKAGTRMSDLMG